MAQGRPERSSVRPKRSSGALRDSMQPFFRGRFGFSVFSVFTRLGKGALGRSLGLPGLGPQRKSAQPSVTLDQIKLEFYQKGYSRY